MRAALALSLVQWPYRGELVHVSSTALIHSHLRTLRRCRVISASRSCSAGVPAASPSGAVSLARRLSSASHKRKWTSLFYRVPVLVSERARAPDEYPCGPCVRPEWSLHTRRRSPQGRRGLIERWPRPIGSTPAPVPAPAQSRRSSLGCTDQ